MSSISTYCLCGASLETVPLLHEHKRTCTILRAACIAEAARIALALYGQVCMIAQVDWNGHRADGFPTATTLVTWCGSWAAFMRSTGAPGWVRRATEQATRAPKAVRHTGALDQPLCAQERRVSPQVPNENLIAFIFAVLGEDELRALYTERRLLSP